MKKNSNQDIALTFYRSFSTLNEMNVKTIFRDSLISPFCSNLSYMSEDKLSQLSNFKYINIETFKKNGSGIKTPIWFIIYQGIIFFRTDSKSGKIKRIRNNPHVRIAPCDIRGNLKGTWFDGKAKFADSNESSIVFSMIDKKYGFLTAIIRSFNKIRGTNPIAMAIVLD